MRTESVMVVRLFGHYELENELVSRAQARGKGKVETNERLGGLLNYYRDAA